MHTPHVYINDVPFHDRTIFRQVIAARGFRDVELLYKVWKDLEEERKAQVTSLLHFFCRLIESVDNHYGSFIGDSLSLYNFKAYM